MSSLETYNSRQPSLLMDPRIPTEPEHGKVEYEGDCPLISHDKHVQHDGINGYGEEIEFFLQRFTFNRIISLVLTWSIELFVFLFMFAYMIRFICMSNLILEKACSNDLNYSRTICKNLSSYEKEKVQVEKLANLYNQYTTITTMGTGALAMIFIGPWSDRYGRKPPLLITMLGIILEDVGVLLNTVYYNASLNYLILPFAASGVTGGFIGIMFIVYSLASEVTMEENRTIKYAILQLAFGLGMSFGTLTGGMLSMYYSYLTVFVVTTLGHILAFFWAFVIPETRGKEVPSDVRWTSKLKALLLTKDLNEGFKAYLKVRPNHGRLRLWLFLVSLCIFMLTYQCFDNMEYTYIFHMYNWSVMKFSIVKTIFGSVGLILIVVCLPSLVRTFHIEDPTLGMIGSVSFAIKSLCTALATYSWIYYLGEICGMLKGMGLLVIRAQVSKIVERDELGKVFTFLAICETLIPVIASIGMTSIYNSTLTYFPGLCYLLTAALLIFPIVSFGWVVHSKIVSSTSKIDSDDQVITA